MGLYQNWNFKGYVLNSKENLQTIVQVKNNTI